MYKIFNLFPNYKNLDSSKLKEFQDGNFKFEENARNFFNRVENAVRKGEIAGHVQLLVMCNFSISYSVFKRLIQYRRENKGLFGKGLTHNADFSLLREKALHKAGVSPEPFTSHAKFGLFHFSSK